MKLFRSVQESCQILGILPSSKNSQSSFSFITLLISLPAILFFISSTAFLLFKAQSIQEYRDSFYIVTSSFVSVANFSVIVRKIPIFLRMIEEFEEFIQKKSQDAARMNAYRRLNADIERVSEMYFLIAAKFSIPAAILPAIILTLLNYFVYNLDDESYSMPSPLLLPFNWRTPFGYLIALSGESLASFSLVFLGIPFVGIFIGSCWLLTAFLRDISCDLANLSVDAKFKRNKKKRNVQFYQTVQNFSDVKRMADVFCTNCEVSIMILFIWMLGLVCNSLIILEIISADDSTSFLDLVKIAVSLFGSCFWLAVFCEFGEMVTTEFFIFNFELNQCKWYLFSSDVQRMFMILLAYTQKPMTIRGYGNMAMCTRESFKKTINGAFSYFMALRRIHR